jgi:citrate lyase subunit beta / citryl-CoA lyase
MRWPIDRPAPCAFLFVPGNSPEKLYKSWQLGAGALIFDLEDAVPESQKLQARQNVSLALKAAPERATTVFVRINDCSTAHWQEDISAATNKNLTGFFLPKCESPGEVSAVAALIEASEKSAGMLPGSISLVALIESARGLVEIPQIIDATDRLAGLALGGEDFCLNMGISRTVEGLELQYARSHLAIWARAKGCLAIDTIYADFHDSQGLMRESQVVKQLGFTAKLAVHPKQLEVIRDVFAPSEEELAEAKKVVEAFAAAQAKGSAVIAVDGKMIDRPVFERAQRLLASAQRR